MTARPMRPKSPLGSLSVLKRFVDSSGTPRVDPPMLTLARRALNPAKRNGQRASWETGADTTIAASRAELYAGICCYVGSC